MKNELFSVRMRASKKGRLRAESTPAPAGRDQEVHISGAEGLHGKSEIRTVTYNYIDRALNHSRGNPDQIVITIEKVKEKPVPVATLPVTTLKCPSPAKAKCFILDMLKRHGVSEVAAKIALKLLYTTTSMRGASLIFSGSGRNIGQGRDRGIRVSRIGIGRQAAQSLADELKKQDLDNDTVKEALILASKVSSCRQVIAEICISDDPDYTTGYISSREAGYVRIPHIKMRNSGTGGRVFFIRDGSDIDSVINYLEKTPVIVKSISPCCGTYSSDEIINSHNL